VACFLFIIYAVKNRKSLNIKDILMALGHFQYWSNIVSILRCPDVRLKNMTKNTEHSEEKKRFLRMPRKNSRRAGFAEAAFMVTGVAMTLVVFSAVNIFVRGIISTEYESIAESGAQDVAESLGAFEKSMDMLASIFSLSGEIDREMLVQKIQESAAPLENFDQVLLAYKKDNAGWVFKPLYARKSVDEGRQVYRLNTEKSVLSRLVQENHFADTDYHVFSAPDLAVPVRGREQEKRYSSMPFVILKAVRREDQNAGLLIAVGQPGAVLDEEWVRKNEMIAKLTIRDPEAGQDIFQLNRYPEKEVKKWTYSQSYEFSFADRKWEVGTDYAKRDNTSFIESVPALMLVFGFILTLAGTGYIRSYKTQEHRLRLLNSTLEEKNVELREEMMKREQLHTALIKSEHENRAVIDSVSDVIFETDTNGKILFLNRTWQKITGFELEQSKELDLFKMLHPQDQEKQRKDFQLLVRGQKQTYRSFTRLRTIDGTFRAVEIAVSMIRQDEAKNPRVVGTLTDVEERRRAERALSEAEKKFRAIVENAAGGIFQLTPEGLYLSANPALARILGYDAPEHLLRLVKNANETVYGNTRERQNFIRELEVRGAFYNHETQVTTLKGERIWVNENVRAVRDESGNTLYYESQAGGDCLARGENKIRSGQPGEV
jgi:PAS domain S-box-containing protein